MIIMYPQVIIDPQELSIVKLSKLVEAGRTCYKSEGTGLGLLEKLIKSGHESVLEHEKATVRIICDRGVSHELVRHRIASYSQESTRYCNYSQDKFGGEITVIRPFFFQDFVKYDLWCNSMLAAEKAYLALLKEDASPQEARSVLPNSLKTEVVMTLNFRTWRHFFKLRALGLSGKPHPQMLQITIPLLRAFANRMPSLFYDFPISGFDGPEAEIIWEEK